MHCNADCENCTEKYCPYEELEKQRDIEQSKAIAEYYEGVENGHS